MKKYALLLVLLMSFILSLAAFAEERGTADEAKKLVKKAIDFYVKNGREKALAEFNKSNSQFIVKDLYIWTENDGVTTSHPKSPAVRGKNWLNLKDANGKLFIKEIVELGKEKGSGWADYSWTDPVTNKVSAKSSYFEKVPIPGDATLIICGFYKTQ